MTPTPEREALAAWIETIKQAHDESLGDEHASARGMLRDLLIEMESALASSPAAGGVQAPEAWIDAVMEQAQVFASARSLVGSRFDAGQGHEDALAAKAELRALLAATPPAAPAQAMPQSEADAADAQRYRWLRDAALGEIVFDHTDSQREGGSRFVLHVPFDGHPINNDEESARALDAAIDAALASREGAAK